MGIRAKHTDNGSVLVLVLVLTAALLVLGGALIVYATSDATISHHQKKDTRLYYIAEAGVEAGVAALSKNYNYTATIVSEIQNGTYTVDFIIPWHHDFPELEADERVIISQGELDGKTLTLRVVVKQHPLKGKAIMVAKKLQLTDVNIFGGLHVNDHLQVHNRRSNMYPVSIGEGEEEEVLTPDLTWSERIDFIGGGTLWIYDYDDEGNLMPIYELPSTEGELEELRIPRIPFPKINFENFRRETQETLTSRNLPVVPDSYPEVNRYYYNGNLDINPSKHDPLFDFDGMLVVDGNVSISPRHKSVPIYLGGIVVARGNIIVDGRVNPPIDGRHVDSRLLLVSQEGSIDVGRRTVEDGDEHLFLGGHILLFAREAINIQHPKPNERYTIRGSLVSGFDIDLRQVDLYYDPDVFDQAVDTLGLGVVIKEWLKP